MFLLAGCAAFEPVNVDEERADYTLSAMTLNREVRTQQRTIEGLRDEVEALKKELATARIAQARMVGQVREVERRFAEARQIVTLQREELSRIREERDKVLSSGEGLQRQMNALQQQLARIPVVQKRHVTSSPRRSKPKANASESARHQPNPRALPQSSVASTQEPAPPSKSVEGHDQEVQSFVAVQPGDTLWSLARRYGVDLLELRALNELTSDRIFPGQALVLPLLLKSSER